MFTCPVCGLPLTESEKTLGCEKGHRYDRARQGYVNLLMSAQSGNKRHGDDKKMVLARQHFLEQGFYQPLADAVLRALTEKIRENAVILDAGCGECWYTAQVSAAARAKGIRLTVGGIDISKEALIAGARRDRELHLAVASAYRLPVADASCDAVLNIFSPCAASEFARVLKPDGLLISAVPLEKHLWSLKAAVYDDPYENPSELQTPPGFCAVHTEQVCYEMHLPDSETIQSLFCMTPYYYKTGEKDQEKLKNLRELDTEAAFGVISYRKADE